MNALAVPAAIMPALSVDDAFDLGREQVAFWRREGMTPTVCLFALGEEECWLHAGWDDVRFAVMHAALRLADSPGFARADAPHG